MGVAERSGIAASGAPIKVGAAHFGEPPGTEIREFPAFASSVGSALKVGGLLHARFTDQIKATAQEVSLPLTQPIFVHLVWNRPAIAALTLFRARGASGRRIHPHLTVEG